MSAPAHTCRTGCTLRPGHDHPCLPRPDRLTLCVGCGGMGRDHDGYTCVGCFGTGLGR